MSSRASPESRSLMVLRARGDMSSLARFEGRPQDLSPKARYNLLLGKLFPNLYG